MKLSKETLAEVDALIALFKQTITNDEWREEIAARQIRRQKYFAKFQSHEMLSGIEYIEFRESIKELWALMGWHNKDYFLQEKIKLNETSFENIRNNIAQLLFLSQGLEERVGKFMASTAGMRMAFASELLMLAKPNDYPLYNAKSKAVLMRLGMYSEVIRSMYRRAHIARGYCAFVATYKVLLEYISQQMPQIHDFATLDTMLWMLKLESFEDADEASEASDDTAEPIIRVVRMGNESEFESVYKLFRENNIAAFGFDDLIEYDPAKENGYNFSALKKIMVAKDARSGRINKLAQYVLQFSRSRVGKDWFVACHRGHMYGFGLVSKPYYRDTGNPGWEHCIGIDWTWFEVPVNMKSQFSKQLSGELSKTSSVSVVNYEPSIIELQKYLSKYGQISVIPEQSGKRQVGRASIESISLQTYLPSSRLEELIQSFREENGKRQIIFDGPPGTGKTHVAQKLAEFLADEEGKPKGEHCVITCHGSLTFEHLFQGLCPNEVGKIIPKKGLLTLFFEKARENDDANYTLVLDEINRCNISQVFGPFLYLLENRDKEVDLPFDGERIVLPSNVFIIATMNSDDRSTGLVDFAFRRRFVHFRFNPDAQILKAFLQAKFMEESKRIPNEVDLEQFVRIFESLNKRLEAIDPRFQVGHSFFMIELLPTLGTLRRLWETEVTPYLEERFYHDRQIVENEFDIDRMIAELQAEKNLILSKLPA